MKSLLSVIAIILFAPAIVWATDVTFAWDQLPEDSDITGVRVYAGNYFGDIDYDTPICVAPHPASTCTTDLSPWRFYKAVGRAYFTHPDTDETIESTDSNMAPGFVWGQFVFRWNK